MQHGYGNSLLTFSSWVGSRREQCTPSVVHSGGIGSRW